MKQYSIFHPLILSFFSSNLYRDIAQNWRGLGFTYLLILTFITISVTLANMYIVMKDIDPVNFRKAHLAKEALPGDPDSFAYEANLFMVTIFEQMPPIAIQNCTFTTNVPQPYIIKDPEGKPAIIIDTTRSVLQTGQWRDAHLIIFDTYVMTVQNNGEKTRSQELTQQHCKDLEGKLFDKEVMYTLADKFVTEIINMAFAAVGAVLLIFMFIMFIVQALIYGIIGLILNAIFGTGLEYPTLVRLSAIAITPLILIDTLSRLVIDPFHEGILPFWPSVAVDLAYVTLAIISNPKQPKPQMGF